MRNCGIALLVLLSAGCERGLESDKPPIHPVHDMDRQPKYKTQSMNAFFTDRAAMRKPVDGTVAADSLHDDILFYQGLDASGTPVAVTPLEVTAAVVEHGKARYAIYCVPCHSPVGDGQGEVIKKGFIPPPVFWEERLVKSGDGYLFGVISNGVRNMPSHATLVPAADRWAIVAYVRSLQQKPAR
jgi:hypothetical protein